MGNSAPSTSGVEYTAEENPIESEAIRAKELLANKEQQMKDGHSTVSGVISKKEKVQDDKVAGFEATHDNELFGSDVSESNRKNPSVPEMDADEV